jgi:hypothetical protein
VLSRRAAKFLNSLRLSVERSTDVEELFCLILVLNWKELAAFLVVQTGGQEETSLGALKDVSTIQAKGTIIRKAPPMMRTYMKIFEILLVDDVFTAPPHPS